MKGNNRDKGNFEQQKSSGVLESPLSPVDGVNKEQLDPPIRNRRHARNNSTVMISTEQIRELLSSEDKQVEQPSTTITFEGLLKKRTPQPWSLNEKESKSSITK